MGTAVDADRVRNLLFLAPGEEATWAIEWSFDALHYASVDATPAPFHFPDPANPGRYLVQSVEVTRQFMQVDDLVSVHQRVTTFRNERPDWSFFYANVIRAPNI